MRAYFQDDLEKEARFIGEAVECVDGPDIDPVFGDCRGGHAALTDVVLGQVLQFRSLLQDDDEAVLAGDVDLAVAVDGRGVVSTAD